MFPKKNPKKIIVKILKKHPEGLTLHSLAELSEMNRLTATKYVHELLGEGIVYQRRVGKAKLCYLKERFMRMVREEEVVKKLKKLK